MTTLERLAVEDVRKTLEAFRDALVLHRPAINALNVYPVPDGDTGTNMSLTLESVVEEVAGAGEDPEAIWKAISHGSLMGGRGNSGVILSQILRGLVQVLSAAPAIDSEAFAAALSTASDAAYGAVPKPVEGTILTVVREVSEAAQIGVAEGDGLVALLDRCIAAGKVSLDGTPELLPVLKDAGVVDAGGAGFLLLLDAFANVVDGRPLPPPPEIDIRAVDLVHEPAASAHDHEPGIADLRYEVMFFLDAPDDSIEAFKAAWVEIGDSIVVVGGDGLWNCHVHTDDIGAAIEAGIEVGRPKQIRVTDLLEEVAHLEEIRHPADEDSLVTMANPEPVTTAVVAVGVGQGVRRIFESLGVQAVLVGGQTMNPSTRQLLQAVDQVNAQEVVILPNNKNIIPVAQQVNAETDKSVSVVPTRTIAEGFASLLAYDPGTDHETNAQGMTEAAEAVVAGEVTQAVRDSKTDAGDVTDGDWIGLDRTGVRSIGNSVVSAATGLLDLLVTDEHELLTIIVGADADGPSVDAVQQWVDTERPEVETEVHQGGQPLYPFFFGVE